MSDPCLKHNSDEYCYNCCSKCNYDRHPCPICGSPTDHNETPCSDKCLADEVRVKQ